MGEFKWFIYIIHKHAKRTTSRCIITFALCANVCANACETMEGKEQLPGMNVIHIISLYLL